MLPTTAVRQADTQELPCLLTHRCQKSPQGKLTETSQNQPSQPTGRNMEPSLEPGPADGSTHLEGNELRVMTRRRSKAEPKLVDKKEAPIFHGVVKQADKEQSLSVKQSPRQFAPDPCTLCTDLRPKNTNYTRVYGHAKVGNSLVRYCRCNFCGNTYKLVEQ
jgi:hypothetical protein